MYRSWRLSIPILLAAAFLSFLYLTDFQSFFSGSTASADQPPREARAEPQSKRATSRSISTEREELATVLRELSDDELIEVLQGGSVAERLQRHAAKPPLLRAAVKQELKRRLNADASPAPDRKSFPPPVIDISTVEDREASTNTQARARTIEAVNNGDQSEEVNPIVDRLPPKYSVAAFSSRPFGVGKIRVDFEQSSRPRIYPDQVWTIEAADNRIFYPATDVQYVTRAGEDAFRVRSVQYYFLFKGNADLQVSIWGGSEKLLTDISVPVEPPRGQHPESADAWWRAFCQPDELETASQRAVHRYLVETLSRRLELPKPPWHQADDGDFLKQGLEAQFERSMRMMLGIESVKLAMKDSVTTGTAYDTGPLSRPLPRPNRLRSVPIPSVAAGIQIEPIAHRVPQECFYVRTKTISNYHWLRRLLLKWGGSLEDIVSQQSVDPQIRHTIQRQLSIYPEAITIADADRMTSDFALIGLDPFFADGAAVGILLKARDGKALRQLIEGQRQQTLREVPQATQQKVTISGKAVLRLATPALDVRSFYAIDGDYHLVTNSRRLVQRFFETGRGIETLGELNEFRYARQETNSIPNQSVFLYLSDPFFQNLIHPHTRVEMQRRAQSLRAIRDVRLARLMAEAEGIAAETVDELITAKLLPAEIARRADGTQIAFSDKRLIDTRRGAAGTFVPIADMQAGKITSRELANYHSFIRTYRREWPMMDPVNVVFTRDLAGKIEEERIGLHIMVAPYAQQRYQKLKDHLAPATSNRVIPKSNDLISLDTMLRQHPTSHRKHALYVGLRDAEVEYTIENGEIEIENEGNKGSYAKTFSYAAISPHSFEMIRLLAKELAGVNLPAEKKGRDPGPGFVPPPPTVVSSPGATMFWLLGNMMMRGPMRSIPLGALPITRDGQWTIISLNSSLRESVRNTLHQADAGRSSQVYFRMGELEGSKVEPYIQAYTFLSARRTSAANAKWIDRFGQQFHIAPTKRLNTLQYAIGSKLVCPLGGKFRIDKASGHSAWTGDAWTHPSLYLVSDAPQSWRFPFLDWVRSLQVNFGLDHPKLNADVQILVRSGDIFDEQAMSFLAMRPLAEPADLGVLALKLSEADRIGPLAVFRPSLDADIAEPEVRSLENRAEVESRRSENDSPTVPNSVREPRQSSWILGVRVEVDGATPSGARIRLVYPGSPAMRSELAVGDVIREVNGRRVNSSEVLRESVATAQQRGNDLILLIERAQQSRRITVSLRGR